MPRSVLIAVLALLAAPAAATERPIVLELFTSQSCSSCPPAEALLGTLAARPDVLPLAMHVTYWDRLGWKDRFSLREATDRQRRYAAGFGADSVYTPQLVVDGARHVVGSDRRAVAAAIAAAEAARARTAGIAFALRQGPDGLVIEIGEGRGAARVWLVGFDPEHVTPVRGGENAGRTLRQVNVVRGLEMAASWDGRGMTVSGPRPAGDRTAALLQAEDGRMLAVAVLPAAP